MTQEIKVTISGPSNSGKTALLSLINLVLNSVAHPKTEAGLLVTIDPNSQTLREGGLLDDDEMEPRLVAMIEKGVKITLTDESDARLILPGDLPIIVQ